MIRKTRKQDRMPLLPESTMTNANISSMVESVDGSILSLEYNDGSQKVVVPPGIPIVALELVNNWSPMEVGSHIFVAASKGDDPIPICIQDDHTITLVQFPFCEQEGCTWHGSQEFWRRRLLLRNEW